MSKAKGTQPWPKIERDVRWHKNYRAAPDYDETTAAALISALWGTSVPGEAGEAGRDLARKLAKAGKKIVDA